MVYLAKIDEMEDASFCLAKEAEYAAKARATNNRAIRSAYEAAAREFAYRVKLIGSKNKAADHRSDAARGPIAKRAR
jgi:hypothetical protein